MNLDELRSVLVRAVDRAECEIAEADHVARRWAPPTASVTRTGTGPEARQADDGRGAEADQPRSSWLV